MNYSKSIYKTDTKDRVRVLHVYVKGSTLYQESGLLTGEKVTHEKVCKGKNIGRSNETSPEQQALLEAKAKITNKMSTGYFDSVLEAQTTQVILPMLAKSYDSESKKIDWGGIVYGQPKLDGMRCLGDDSLISRDGKVISTLTHILEEVKSINLHLDGELYAHGLSFQDNMKLIKKVRDETISIKYHVYDLVSDKSFDKRHIMLRDAVKECSNILLVPTFVLEDEKHLKKYHQQNLAAGYEGTIIRHGDAPYKVSGRSSNLLKYKDFFDIACEIIDIEPAEQRPNWGVPVLKYLNHKMSGFTEKIFRAGMKYSHKEREEFLTNKDDYIGKTAEIRFFEWTDDGLPRFPVMVGIRLDK
jgi:DNA ligase-1